MVTSVTTRMDQKHFASSIFGSYILKHRIIPGIKENSDKERKAQNKIIEELIDYIEQA